mmetsp:Transcript_2846/g.2669  ORF Transcript_2846/g.2669 Transcript_2846/m.2669 type:complete len:131 (+) Transcript_2846:155-547(+)
MSEINNGKIDSFFNSENANWAEIRLHGKFPERKGYHSSVIYNKKLYIFGGHDIREGEQDSLWCLDLTKQPINANSKDTAFQDPSLQSDKKAEWIQLPTSGKEKPGKLSHHSAVIYNDKMYIFGGNASLVS